MKKDLKLIRREIQGRKFEKIVKDLDCCEHTSIKNSLFSVWHFSFYLRKCEYLTRCIVFFRPVRVSCSFSKNHIPEFLPF
jgi:hypothetical protein